MNTIPRPPVAALALLLALAVLAPDARAQAPDPESLARLSSRLEAARFVRVRTGSGAWVERSVRLTPEGVALPGMAQYGETAVSPPQPALVPWSQVAAIETRHSYSGAGMLGGGLVGLALTGLVASNAEGLSDDARPLTLALGALAGALVGAVAGAAADPWAHAWPPRR